MKVIGLAGQMRAGKDTIGDCLRDQLNAYESGLHRWRRTAFAANVKKVIHDWFDVDYNFIEEWKVKDEPPPGFDMTIRKALQWVGDGFRQIRSGIWIDLIFRDEEPKIVSDVRYVNEFKAIRKHDGFNLLVARPDLMNGDPHPSEAQIRPYVQYALEHFKEGPLPNTTYNGERVNKFRKTVIRETVRDSQVYFSPNPPPTTTWEELPEPPEAMCDFDYFLLNDGTLEDLYNKIKNQLLPYIRKFNFEKG